MNPRSRTFWVGVAGVILGLANAIFKDATTINGFGEIIHNLAGLPGAEILGGLAAIFGRDALAKIQAQLNTIS